MDAERTFSQTDVDRVAQKERERAERRAAKQYREQIELLAKQRADLEAERDELAAAFAELYTLHTGKPFKAAD